MRSHYHPHERVTKKFNLPSLTKQSFQDETNINTIMAKYEKTGIIEHTNAHQGEYGDYTELLSYQDSLNAVIEAKEMFMSLPASVRQRFDNHPGKFLDFANNEENEAEMRQMGLIPEIRTPVEGGEAPGSSPANETPEPSTPEEGE